MKSKRRMVHSFLLYRVQLYRSTKAKKIKEKIRIKIKNQAKMATLSLHFSPPIRTRSFPTIVACSNGVSMSKPRSNGGPVVMEIPLEKIRRPLMRVRSNDPDKVKELMDSIRVIGLQVPIDVLEVDGVYYGFSGCHRYEAHQQLGLPTIRCKVRRGTKETLRHHLR